MDRTDYCYGRIDPFDNKTPYRCALRERGLAPGCKFLSFFFLHTFFDLFSWTSSEGDRERLKMFRSLFVTSFFFISRRFDVTKICSDCRFVNFFPDDKNVLCSVLLIWATYGHDLWMFYMWNTFELSRVKSCCGTPLYTFTQSNVSRLNRLVQLSSTATYVVSSILTWTSLRVNCFNFVSYVLCTLIAHLGLECVLVIRFSGL